MICTACSYTDLNSRRVRHDLCPGGNWCDCQHKEGRVLIDAKEE